MLEDHGPHTSSSTAPSQPTPPLLQAEGREWVRPLSFRMFLPSSCPSHIWTEYRFPGFLFLSSQKLPMSISKSPFFFWLHYLTSIPSSLLTFFLHQMGLNEFCIFKTPFGCSCLPSAGQTIYRFTGMYEDALWTVGISGVCGAVPLNSKPVKQYQAKKSCVLTRSNPWGLTCAILFLPISFFYLLCLLHFLRY